MPFQAIGVLLFQHPNGRGRREHDVDLVLLHQRPPNGRIRAHGQAFVDQGGHAVEQWPVHDVAVAHHPTNVAGAEEGFAGLGAENLLHRGGQSHGIAPGVALHAFGFAGGAAGVQRVAGVGGLHPLARHDGVHHAAAGIPVVHVTRRLHVGGCQVAINQQHMGHGVAALAQGLVQQGLVRNDLAATRARIGRHDDRRPGIVNAAGQGVAGKAAKHHRVNGPQAHRGQHGNHRLRDHGHVDQHPVPLAHTQAVQDGGHALHLDQQLAVAERLFGVGFGGHEHQRGLVSAVVRMAVHRVVTQVGQPAHKPFCKRRLAVVTHRVKRAMPMDAVGLFGPVSVAFMDGTLVQRAVAHACSWIAPAGDRGFRMLMLDLALDQGEGGYPVVTRRRSGVTGTRRRAATRAGRKSTSPAPRPSAATASPTAASAADR